MKKLITVIAALAVGVTFATAADAEKKGEAKKGGHNPEETFKKLDTNGDGSVSLDEFKAGPMGKKDPTKAEEMFKKRDTNGDGKLSMEEFSAGRGKKAEGAAPATAKTPDAPATPAAPADAAPAK